MSLMSKAHSTRYGMGTIITHEIYGKKAKYALSHAQQETTRLEKMLSRYCPSSDIGRLNRFAGHKCVKIKKETFAVLAKAQEIAIRCQSGFDVTVGPLVDLWRQSKEAIAPPSLLEIRQCTSLVNSADLHLNPKKRRAFLPRAGQSVDLGGIAKGYAADSILTRMRQDGITSAFTDFGGNVAVIGKNPDGRLWRIGIQHPRKENALLGVVSLTDQSIVTSGDYHQYFLGNDHKRYHHLIDPATGYPSESGLISASIISPSSFEADALSTAVFLAGKEKGIRLLSHFPDAMAILVESDLTLHISNRLQACFEPAEGIDIHLFNERKGNVSNES